MKSCLSHKNFFVVLVCAAVLGLAAAVASGRTINVRADGTGDYPTIQDAIDDCNDGDIIACANGVYTGPGNRDIDFLGKAITVRSENGPNNCIIDCQNSGIAFYFESGEDANSVLAGFTITGGGGTYGGGIYCYDSSPTITNCTFNSNRAIQFGGAIYCSSSSNPTIHNCTFAGNRATNGGGIYCKKSSPSIANCIFNANEAGAAGGAIRCGNSNPTITNCTFNRNTAGSGFGCNGGAIQCYKSIPVVINSILWSDLPDEIHIQSGQPAVVTFSDVQDGYLGSGNIDVDPCFAFGTDFHLMPESLCINTGTNNPPCGLPDTDIEGITRPLDGIADIGAYEYDAQNPRIALEPSYLAFGLAQGTTSSSQTLLIRNCGSDTLNWKIIEDCDWLQAIPHSGLSIGQINGVTLMVDTNSLASGDYTCLLKVVDPNAVNSPVTVQVSLYVPYTLYVPADYSTIQAAIDAARDLDTVIVADGTYTGDGNRDIDFKGKAITVRSENGPENCIIDCQGAEEDQHRGFYFHSGEKPSSTIHGFTITGGFAKNTQPDPPWPYPPLTKYGGGIYCKWACPTITNCVVSGNLADSGGGICVDNLPGWPPFNPTIANCLISGDSATRDGGGIYCTPGTIVENCTIFGNRATKAGGGYCSRSSSDLPPEFEGSLPPSGPEYDSEIINCIFFDNLSNQGPQIAAGSPQTSPPTPPPWPPPWWPGFGNYPTEVLSEQTDTNLPVLSVKYSDIQGEQDGLHVGYDRDLKWGPGNIDDDPCFVQPGYWDTNSTLDDANDDFWVEGDYHLWGDSPCIDAGDPNYIPEPNETDLDGRPRVIGGRIDMGAYEFNYLPVACIVGGDRTIEAGSSCEARVTLDGSCSSDGDSTLGTNDDIVYFDWYEVIDACEPNSDIFLGSGEIIECNLPLGEHIILLEVTDKAGAFDANEVTITVEDTAPPEFSLSVKPKVLWPANHKMVKITPSWEASDNCDESLEVTLVSITMDEEDDAKGDGHTSDDIQISANGSIYLRAERSGKGTGRVYTITYQAVDDSGNVTVDSATVTVPHDKRRAK